MILKLLSSRSKVASLMGVTTSSPKRNSWVIFLAEMMTRFSFILKSKYRLKGVEDDSEDAIRGVANDSGLRRAARYIKGFIARNGFNAVHLAGRQVRNNDDVFKRQRVVFGGTVVKDGRCCPVGVSHLATGRLIG